VREATALARPGSFLPEFVRMGILVPNDITRHKKERSAAQQSGKHIIY
jgi:hypothetical protein